MKRNNTNELAANFGMNMIIRFKYLWIILITLLAVGGYFGAQRIVMDSSNESFVAEGDDTVTQNNRFKEIFGNEEFVFILVEADDVFQHDVLAYIHALSDDLKANLPFVKEITSLADVELIEGRDETLYVEDLIGDTIPADLAELQAIKQKALAQKLYQNRILTPDARHTGLFISFERLPEYVYLPVKPGFSPLDEARWSADKVILQDRIFTEAQAQQRPELKLSRVADPRKLIPPALNVILARHPTTLCTVKATGMPVLDYTVDQLVFSEGTKFGLLALIASILLLLLIFRSATGVIVPVLILALTLVMVYGLMGWAKLPVSLISVLIPPLLFVISVSYSIHVINHVQHGFRDTGSRLKAIRYAYRHATWPCLFTALTTIMGFVSFVFIPMQPIRDVGIACAIGVAITFALVMVLIPISFSFGRDRQPNRPTRRAESSANLEHTGIIPKFGEFSVAHPWLVGITFLLALAPFIGYSFKFRIDSDFFDMLGDRVQFVQDSRYITSRLGGIYSYEVFIELPEAGMAKDPEVLRVLDTVTETVNAWDSTQQSMSLNDLIRQINMTMNNNDPAYDAIPDDPELIAQYLLLYEMSGGDSLDDWVDYEYQYLRLSVQASETSAAMQQKLADLTHMAAARLPAGTSVRVVGDIPMLLRMISLLSSGQVQSMLTAFLMIAPTMMLVIRSFKVGLIAMIPNVLPMLFVTGAMGILDYPLDMVTVMVIPTLLGIAVDDTIHYAVHFKQAFLKTGSYRAANRDTLHTVGNPMVFASMILILGFGTMSLALFKSMVNTGILSVIGILTAMLTELCLSPILFVYLKPFGKEAAAREPEDAVYAQEAVA